MGDILDLNSKFGKAMASKLLSSVLSKKLGFKVVIDLDMLRIKNDGRNVHIWFAGSGRAPTESIKF